MSVAKRAAAPLAVLLLLALAGCGTKQYPVRGKVTFDDGTPLSEGMVVAESKGEKPVTVRGEIQSDGSFTLGTQRAGDGVPPGTYRVQLVPRYDPAFADRPKPPPFDSKYGSFATSQLELVVTEAGAELPITVTRRKK
jgi:hypothetical protein